MYGLESTRVTVFHVLWLVAVVAGTAGGLMTGLYYFSTIGAVVGAILGFLIGHILGGLPDWYFMKLFFRQLERSSIEELRSIVSEDHWNFRHTMALLNLGARGEDVRSELPRIVEMLGSHSTLTRRYGWDALRIVFTEETEHIPDYNPRGPAEECASKAAILKTALQKSDTCAKNGLSPTQEGLPSFEE